MSAPYSPGTVVTHQPTNAQGQPSGAPYDAVWKPGNVVEFYYPVPPPPDTFKKVVGVWNDEVGGVVLPAFVYRYGPGANFGAFQGTVQTSHGTATAVA